MKGITVRFLRNTFGSLGVTQADIGILILCTFFMALTSICGLRTCNFEKLFNSNYITRWSFYIALVMIIITLAKMADVPFLYFQF